MVGSVFVIRRGSTSGFAAGALLVVVMASGCSTAGSAATTATRRPSAAASVAAAPATVGTFELTTAWPDTGGHYVEHSPGMAASDVARCDERP